MSKKRMLILFFLPLIVLCGWTIGLFIQQSVGTEVKVAIYGYDPRDLLSGHYIQYQINWDKTDCSQFPHNRCPKYEFCEQIFHRQRNRQCRFYIPETNAGVLDKLLRTSRSENFEVIYSYHPKRKPLAKKLLINGKDWQEYLSTFEKEI